MKAIYPGSFDPITNGHLDVIERTVKLFNEVIIAVLSNQDKEGFISIKDRIELVKESVKDLKNVTVENFN